METVECRGTVTLQL